MTTDPYVYPGTSVLRNKLGIRDASLLDKREREFVVLRMMQGAPKGNFDLAHLQAIHHHLFQDIYDWAGQIRTVEISKGGSQFQPRRFIETGMADVHRRIMAQRHPRSLSVQQFAEWAGQIMGDVNYVHPFREGNGRTQLQYLKRLGEHAGWQIDLTKLGGQAWIEASREAQRGRYDLMGECIKDAIAEKL